MIELKGIKKSYLLKGESAFTLGEINLTFPDNGFVAILGPSGCGKTTLLNVIGGLDQYQEGDLLVNQISTKNYQDKDWDAYRNTHIGFVFQNYNLIAHFSVLENVEVPLMLNGAKREERKQKAKKALALVGLESEEEKKPTELSGGQMQRVAIARAMVNEPAVILADEPTGALDSKTSVQVMDLLKEISKKRLVIMVTHNALLAEKYASRIIEMEDGKIVKDSNPYTSNIPAKTEDNLQKRTSMSLWTAIRTSFGSLSTKKGRTFLTILATCFGVIGVSLVLAITNGFSNFVTNVESSIASSMPITISRSQVSLIGEENEDPVLYPEDDNLYVYNGYVHSYISHTNDLNNSDYINQVLNPLIDDGLAKSILINREGLDFNIITELGVTPGSGEYVEVNQYDDASLGASLVSGLSPVPSTIFHELYMEEEGLSDMYDLIYGKFPTNPNEVVLITDEYNRVDVATLVDLGFYASQEDAPTSISFADIVTTSTHQGKTFKVFPVSSYYKNPKEITIPSYQIDDVSLLSGASSGVYVEGKVIDKTITLYDKPTSEDFASVYNDPSYEGMELEIVGVIRPSEDTYITLMPSSIGYLSSLTDYFVEDINKEETKTIQEAATEAWYIPETININGEGRDGLAYLNEKIQEAVTNVQSVVSASEGSQNSQLAVAQSLQSAVNNVSSAVCWVDFSYYEDTGDSVSYRYSTSCNSFLANAQAIGANFRQDEVASIMESLQEDSDLSLLEILSLLTELITPDFFDSTSSSLRLSDFLAYTNSYSNITSILIFPESLTTKPAILERLDSYNEGKATQDQILYTDLMGNFTDALSMLIDMISLVLIVFASLSLIVSSIMTAVTTYVSVLERTKEIGVLRACGARKKDVGHLFEAECLLVGFASGVIGVLLTLVLCLPINVMINSMFMDQRLGAIAVLAWYSALIMIVISTLLSWLAGFIPSRIAAKKDPVAALRSE